MLIVVNAAFPMFSFCYLPLLYMFRRGAREGKRFLFSHRSHRCAQMPFGVLLVFHTDCADGAKEQA